VAVKRVRMQDVRIKYVVDYWDGPLSGVAEIDGKKLYFDVVDEDFTRRRRWILFGDYVFTRIRQFCFYDLPPAFWAEEDERHRDFLMFVGGHCDYDKHGKPSGTVKPSHLHDSFYRKWGSGERLELDKQWLVAVATEISR